jgi:hypothetical protein
MENVPKFKHDCGECVFLGIHNDHDLYYCFQSSTPTVIARYGSEGWDYKSGLVLADFDEELSMARDRAEKKGLRVTF